MTYSDLLDFAIDEKTSALVDIRQVENGMRCGCLCPECGRKLVAKKGPRNRHHFAHLPKDQRLNFCAGGAETGLHRAAKQIIAGWRDVVLPALKYSVKGRNRFGGKVEVIQSIAGDFFPVESSVLPDEEYWPEDWIPDVVLRGAKGELRVEVKVTHGISGDKQLKIDRDGINTIEYDLGSLRNEHGWNLVSLEHALKNDPKVFRWAFHQQLADLKERTHRELSRQIYESAGKLIKDAPVFGEGELVFHPWFGLVPKDIQARQEFVGHHFAEPQEYELKGGITIKIRQHAALHDSWLVVFVDNETRIPLAGHYDSLLSEHLLKEGYRSIYFGIGNMRIVRGAETSRPILDFIRRYESPLYNRTREYGPMPDERMT